MKNYAVVGCGGIGYHLVPLFARFVSYDNGDDSSVPTLTLVDGDVVEDHNLARGFTEENIGENKAEVLAEHIRSLVKPGSVDVRAVPEFIDPMRLARFHKGWFKDGVTVFSGVDNNATRVLLELTGEKLNNFTFVSGGNSYEECQALLYVRRAGKDLCPPTFLTNPDIVSNTGDGNHFPTDANCSAEYESAPQLSLINNLAATMMVGLYYDQCVRKSPEENGVNINAVYGNLQEGGRVHQFLQVPEVTRESLDFESALLLS